MVPQEMVKYQWFLGLANKSTIKGNMDVTAKIYIPPHFHQLIKPCNPTISHDNQILTKSFAIKSAKALHPYIEQ